jgi:hypothetical protein
MRANHDDAFWRRPAGMQPGGSTDQPSSPPAAPAGPTYAGPPRTAPPPAGWRPPTVVEPEPPRRLPAQDTARLDREEAAAATLTKGMGLLAGAVMLVLLLVLCGRWVF